MPNYYNVPMLNKILIIGTVVNDPRISLTNESKNKVANFRIACTRKFRTKSGSLKEEICYVSVTAWLKLAEICENNLEKSDRVYIEGSLQSKQLNDSKMSIVEILAERIQILTPKKIVSSTGTQEQKLETDKEVKDEEVVEEHGNTESVT